MPKFKIEILSGSKHIFTVDDKSVLGFYQTPTVNGKYMYVSEYFVNSHKIYEIKEAENYQIETIDRSLEKDIDLRDLPMGSGF